MSDTDYKKFSVKAAIELAAPPTWAAAIMSVLVGGAAAFALSPWVSFVLDVRALVVWALMMVIAIMMQSAVNTLNDYKDFLAGTDSAETVLDEHDASIVYNHINPKAALRFSIILMVCAFAIGLVVVWLSHWVLLVVGLSAAFIVIFYSVGPKPISYLPIGEVVSGVTMGGLITFSTCFGMTLNFSALVLAICVPPIITIALIMLTNNTCDIERDIESGRKTLPVLLGREKSMRLGQALAWGAVAFMVIFLGVLDIIIWRSLVVLGLAAVFAVVLYLLLRPMIARIAKGPYSLRHRKQMMGNVVGFCYLTNALWILMLIGAWILGVIVGAI